MVDFVNLGIFLINDLISVFNLLLLLSVSLLLLVYLLTLDLEHFIFLLNLSVQLLELALLQDGSSFDGLQLLILLRQMID